MRKKCVLYCRSCEDEDYETIDRQKRELEQYCLDNDLLIERWYVDVGTKDGLVFNKELTRLLTDTVSGVFDLALVTDNHLLTNDLYEFFYISFMLEKKHCKLHCLRSSFDGVEDQAELLSGFVTYVANRDRLEILDRMTRGRKKKAKSGLYSGGRPPYGYDVHNGKLVVNQHEAAVVHILFRDRDYFNRTYGEIAETLTSLGIKPRNGGEWQISTLSNMWRRRPFYEGSYSYSGNRVTEGAHEPILKKGEYLFDIPDGNGGDE